MKPTEEGLTTLLRRACFALVALIIASTAFNLPVIPLPWNDGGRFRDELVQGWNEGRNGDDPSSDPTAPSSDVAASSADDR
jgi:hypothetical protein